MTRQHATSSSTGRRRIIRRDPTIDKVVVVGSGRRVGAQLPVNVGLKGYAQRKVKMYVYNTLHYCSSIYYSATYPGLQVKLCHGFITTQNAS